VVSADWVVRYNNRWLQWERQSQHWAPAKSRVLVRENEAGDVAIHYRGQRLRFRELKAASTVLGEGRGVAPAPAPPSPILRRSLPPAPNHPWRKGFSAKARALFIRGSMKPNPGDISIVDKTGTFLLWYDTPSW
jgi:hypothetical protein